MKRQDFLAASLGVAGAAALTVPGLSQDLTPLDVAYAGSMGSMMEGPVKAAVAKTLGIAMRGRAAGSDALAKLIVGGTIPVDVFVPVTPGPMQTVITAGKAAHGVPIARTEMVIAYSPKSQFADAFKAQPWYEVLMMSGVRFGRTDPATDPQGRNIIFTMQLAETYYKVPGIAKKILGDDVNPSQIFAEPTVEARLQSGELDAASAYRIQPGPFNLPYVTLPDEINLGNQSMHEAYQAASLTLAGKTYHPQALVYYAGAITGAPHADKAAAFVQWFTSGEGQEILKQFAYDSPSGAETL
jgi:molybdate/tungstate transport system substrate-binding protein